MQRWWYLDSKVKSNDQSERRLPSKSKSIEVSDGGERKWLFRVLVTQKLNAFESICVTGECSALGNWIPQHCVLLQKEDGKKTFLFLSKLICFRCFIFIICVYFSFYETLMLITNKTPV